MTKKQEPYVFRRTLDLRFVIRPVRDYDPVDKTTVDTGKTARVLQQWWAGPWDTGEWRDVPLEEETDG